LQTGYISNAICFITCIPLVFCLIFHPIFPTLYHLKHKTMARSRRQRRIDARDEREGKKITSIILISTLVLIALMYIVYVSA